MNAYINILHLTDIHLLPTDNFNQKLILAAALKDIASLKGGRLQPDLVIVSGDLAYAADEPQSYTHFLDLMIQVAESVGLDEEKIILCPGNHDLSRAAIGWRLPDVQKWQRHAADRDFANGLPKDGQFASHVYKAFAEYNSLAANFSRAAHLNTGLGYETFFFRDLALAVVVVNTATLSTGGLIEGCTDERKLVLPEALLEEALGAIPDGSHAIVVGHHPTGWLNESNQDVIENILSRRASAYLSGHLHAARPKTVHSLGGQCFFGQSGALYEKRDRWNGYCVYSVAPGSPHVKAHFRRWFEDRREFSKAEDLISDGISYSSPEAKPFFEKLRPPLDRRALEQWRTQTLLPALETECSQSLSPAPLESSFVPPEFSREIPHAKESVEKLTSKVEIVTFDKAMQADANLLVSAPSQSGKTTLLRRWALTIARQSAADKRWTVPVIISFGDIREYASYIENLIARKLPHLGHGLQLSHLLEQGAITLFVDDLDFKKRAQLRALAEFMNSYRSCRFVLTTAASLIDSAAWEPVVTPDLPFTHVRLRPMRRRQLLSLIEGHGVDDPQKADQLLERVAREARSLNVPLTAVTSTFLIQVFSTEPDRVLVNQATLVERYIELLLQRFARPDIELRSFDFKLKRDLLAVIAGNMAVSENYTPSYNTVLQWTLDYVNHYGFPQEADQIVEHFIACRILERVDGADGSHLRFPLTAFLSYFIAWRMIEEKDFRAWVFDAQRYLSYMDEVSFYAALVRNDLSAVNFIFQEFERLSDEMWVDASEEVRSGTFMDTYVEPNSEASEEEVFAIQQVVRSNEETDAERKFLLDDTVGPMEAQQRVNRPEFQSIGDRWHAHLVLTSMVLKHMELISDVNKRALLKAVLTAWLQFCTLSLSLVPQIARDKVITFNGVTYKLSLQGDEPIGEIARRISIAMPLAVSNMATGLLGSEKLRRQLQDGIGSDTLSPSDQLLRALLLADIGVDDVAAIFKNAATGVQGHRYLTSVLGRKLYDVAIRFRLDDDSVEQIRTLASELLVRLEGKGPLVSQSRKNQIVKSLRDQRLVAQMTDRQ